MNGVGLGLDVLAQDRKLVAAQAGHGVAIAGHLTEPLGDRAQGFVARRVAQAVVHQLEPVDVQEQDGEVTALCGRPAGRARLVP